MILGKRGRAILNQCPESFAKPLPEFGIGRDGVKIGCEEIEQITLVGLVHGFIETGARSDGFNFRSRRGEGLRRNRILSVGWPPPTKKCLPDLSSLHRSSHFFARVARGPTAPSRLAETCAQRARSVRFPKQWCPGRACVRNEARFS